MSDERIEQAFNQFYESPVAQDYCFSNYNNASRDESVGRFCFEHGYNQGAEDTRYRIEKKLALAEGEVIRRGDHANILMAKLELANEALKFIMAYKVPSYISTSRGSVFDVANKALKQLSE